MAAYQAHIKPFVDHKKDEEIILLHMNNLYGHLNPDDLIPPHLHHIDLSNLYNIYKTLRELRLDFIVLFNPGNVYEQLIIMVARDLKIPTIYFQHGLNPDYNKIGIYESNSISIQKYFAALRKYFHFYVSISSYLIARPTLSNLKSVLKRTINLVLGDKNSIVRNYGSKSNHTDFALVYNIRDKEMLVDYLNIHCDHVKIMGYPFDDQTDIQIPGFTDYILYISSGLRKANVVNITKEEEISFLKEIIHACNENGYKLIIKTHPLDDYQYIHEQINDTQQFKLVSDYNLPDLVCNSSLVLGDFSTALFYAVRYLKPIIILTYNFISNYTYDLTDYGIGIKTPLKDLENFLKVKDSYFQISEPSYRKFLNEEVSYSGKNQYDYFFEILQQNSWNDSSE